MITIYLSDLNDNVREGFEQEVKRLRPDLVSAIDEGDTIVLAEVFGDQIKKG